MKAQTLSIDSLTGVVTPGKPLIIQHGAALVLSCAFITSGQPGVITDLTADTLRFGLKKKSAPNADESLVGLGTWETAGTGATTRYVLTVTVDSVALRTALGTELSLECVAQIAWSVDDQDAESKTFLIPITVEASATMPDDSPPDISEADLWTYFKARVQAGVGLTKTVNEGAQTITLAASGGSFNRVTADMTAINAADATVFTIPVEASSTYELKLRVIGYLETNEHLKMWGTLPASAAAHGRWAPLVNDGDEETLIPHVFTETTNNQLIATPTSGVAAAEYVAPYQSFIVVTAGTAGDIVIKARASDATGKVLAGTHYVMTKLA